MSAEERDLLRKCTQQVEETLQWGNCDEWSNSDYEDLSNRIFEKTQVKLSISTLKRIWGKVKYESSFNKSTLNALAQFVGVENWRTFSRDFSIENAASVNHHLSIEEEIKSSPVDKKKRRLNNTTLRNFALGFIAIIVVGLFLFSFKKETRPEKVINPAVASFKSKKTTNDLPNSVIFNYDVSAYGVDSAIIQQNWDPRRQEKVSTKKNVHTSIYYYPGNFNARLIVNNQVVKTHRVFIKTKGWKGIIENKPIPIYLSEKEIDKKGAIGIDNNTLKEKINKSVFNEQWVNFYNIREFEGLNSDNFSLETELKNTSSLEESICRKVKIFILFNGGAVIIPLSDKGCVSSLELFTGAEVVGGKDNDLSEFGCDFTKPQKVKCVVQNKNLSISLNDRKIFTSSVDIKEEIVGLYFAFEGTGEIKMVRLGEPGKFPVYYERF